jgi:hypothetical protein
MNMQYKREPCSVLKDSNLEMTMTLISQARHSPPKLKEVKCMGECDGC